MKRIEPEQIGALIDRLMSENNLSDEVMRRKVCYLWPEVVGQGINRYTTRRWIQDSTLHVYISSPALKNDLMFHRTRLIALLNQAAGADPSSPVITDIAIH